MSISNVRIVKADQPDLRKKAFQIREEVFVVEQQVAHEEEFDEFEDSSIQLGGPNQKEEPAAATPWRTH
jgi:predicted GNAT family N-acyltransferase